MIITLTTTDNTGKRTHFLTQDEMTVLQLALKYFNENALPLCSEEREQKYLNALKHLQDLVVNAIEEKPPADDNKKRLMKAEVTTKQWGQETVKVRIAEEEEPNGQFTDQDASVHA